MMRTAHEMRARATHEGQTVNTILMSPTFDEAGARQIIAAAKQVESTIWEVGAEICDRLDELIRLQRGKVET